MTLNSMSYAQSIIQSNLTIPKASVLGSGWSVKGVQITVPPQNDTTVGGTTFRNWAINIILSNQQFSNGTTLSSSYLPGSVIVTEGASTGYGDSYQAAMNFMAPDELCQVSINTVTKDTSTTKVSTSTCYPSSVSSPLKLVQIGNTYLAVDPNAPNAYFQIDSQNMIVQISGHLNYSQMISLAGNMIPASTQSTG